jgi:hypothetical protein
VEVAPAGPGDDDTTSHRLIFLDAHMPRHCHVSLLDAGLAVATYHRFP